jgi:hypothetical protein
MKTPWAPYWHRCRITPPQKHQLRHVPHLGIVSAGIDPALSATATNYLMLMLPKVAKPTGTLRPPITVLLPVRVAKPAL